MAEPEVQINRNPFGRETLYRRLTTRTTCCAECGHAARFEYAWIADGINPAKDWSVAFCSVGCYRIYYS